MEKILEELNRMEKDLRETLTFLQGNKTPLTPEVEEKMMNSIIDVLNRANNLEIDDKEESQDS